MAPGYWWVAQSRPAGRTLAFAKHSYRLVGHGYVRSQLLLGGGRYAKKRECTGNDEQGSECKPLNRAKIASPADKTAHEHSHPSSPVQSTQETSYPTRFGMSSIIS